jgi:hypothetical protein
MVEDIWTRGRFTLRRVLDPNVDRRRYLVIEPEGKSEVSVAAFRYIEDAKTYMVVMADPDLVSMAESQID